MKLRPSMLLGVSLTVALFCVTGIAFAQTAPAAPAGVTISTQTAIVTICALLAGFIGQSVNTGSFFGIVTEPKAWIPYLTLAGSFVAAFGLSIQGASAVNSASILNAVIAGFMALSSAGAGAAAHGHLNAHKSSQGKAPAPAAPPADGGGK